MSKRTDLAAPTVIDPAAFTFVAGVYFGSNQSEDFNEYLNEWATEMGLNEDGKAGWYFKKPYVLSKFPPLVAQGNFVRKGTCDHCGARFDWGSVYQHTSGGHIVVGNTCADETMRVPNRLTLDAKRLKARMKAHAEMIRDTARACEQAIAGGFVWLYVEDHTNPTLADIARKGLAWGGLTPAQIELIDRIRYGKKAQWQIDKESGYAAAKAREAARAAEEAAAQPVPVTDARIRVKGAVLTIKEKAGYMPGTTDYKMLVKTEAGFKVYGTVPRGFDIQKGVTVEFDCAVRPSPSDNKFGFFSRPTKVRVTAASVGADSAATA